MEKMETKLKAIRTGNKSAVTKLFTKFEELKEKSDTEQIDVKEFKAIENAVVKKQNILCDLNEKLIEVLPDEDIAQEIEDSDEYMFNLDAKVREIQSFAQISNSSQTIDTRVRTTLNGNAESFTPRIETVNTNTSAANSDKYRNSNGETSRPCNPSYNFSIGNPLAQSMPTCSSEDRLSVQQMRINQHSLPKLDLPRFDGDVLLWNTFWDSYESTIHYNSALTPIQKFSYLKAQIAGTAAQTIAGFALTNANYETAVALLRERFGQPQKIINAHMKALMDLPSPRNELVSLRSYGDYLETYVRGLECLGQTQEMYGALLVPIIISKLPVEIRKNIAREYDCDNINLKTLRTAIAKEVRVLESGQFTKDVELPHSTVTFFASARDTRKPQHTAHSSRNNERYERKKMKVRPCIYCNEIHFPAECKKIVDTNSRLNILKKKSLCFNCLGNHRVSECKSKNRCKRCNNKHHTSICEDTNVYEKRQSNEKKTYGVNIAKTDESDTTILYSSNQSTNVLLKTAIAPVIYRRNSTEANILLDEGAQRTFITQSLADKLQIEPSGRDVIEIAAFGNTAKKVRHLETANIDLLTENGERIAIRALIVPDIAIPLQNRLNTIVPQLPYLKGLKLAHPMSADDKFEISLLIGGDYYWEIVGDTIIRGNGPTAVSSKIGYLLSGPGPKGKNTDNKLTSSVLLNIASNYEDENSIEKFWSLESVGIKPPQQDDDECYLKTYQQNYIKYENGHYCAKLPWKPDFKELPTNYGIVKARTENTIRRLSRDPHLLQVYSDIIQDQERRGFIEKVENEGMNEPGTTHYIPHHAVKKDSTTTPIRIVYDCSCKQTTDHSSLNDCLMSVPPDLNDLTKILMRFRAKQYGISTDIEKAFLHVGLDECDRDMTRFFWLKDPRSPGGPLTTFRFKSVLFGATCSPFILNATILKHLDETNTEVCETMKRDLYVDNILSSVDGENEASRYFAEAREIMSKAGFNLRSWSSNCEKLIKQAESERVLEVKRTVKILGLTWNTDTDKIGFQGVQLSSIKIPNITKREILRQSSRIFDPLGLLSPISVRAKIMMQQLWKQKIDWDEVSPIEIQKSWIHLAQDLEIVSTIELDRKYHTNCSSINTKLHVFVDASESAYGAAVYISNENESTLVIAKNRVAPLKQLTLPQLELMAALVGARLGKHASTTLDIKNVTYWSDSQIVLQWLSSSKQLKKFIRNRVTEIHTLTETNEWRYCPTKQNPADLQTRGLKADDFQRNKTLWFCGPTWITNRSEWPTWTVSNNAVLLSNIVEEPIQTENEKPIIGIQEIININRYSTLSKLLRITSYVYRFVQNCRLNQTDRNFRNYVSSDELSNATEIWIKSCQKSSYSKEISGLKCENSKRTNLERQLKLYLDKDILRCGGRIHNAPLDEEARFPILLPSKHQFTKLLIQDVHNRVKHAGVLSTVNVIRQKYWIPRIRQIVRSTLRGCVTCRKVLSKPFTAPDPPPLQKDRLLAAPPFTVTGVDFAGPFYVKGQLDSNDKAFICLFTCASTRAVHLEMVHDLTESSFLQAFRRFTSRKSLPTIMISDNASTYIAASSTLKTLTESPKINSNLSHYGTIWKFIPKRAPWYGGFWERLIGLTKSCLKKTLGRSYVTYELLQTIVIEIEAIINDRPLTHISSEADDCEPLTPSHLLYGRRIITTPYPKPECGLSAHQSGKHELCERFKRQTVLIDNFWNRWKLEYLTSLREHHRQTGNNSNIIHVGDVVLVHDDKLPRNKWNMAVVEKLSTGKDNLTRSAFIKTSNGLTSRPIVKLYPIEVRNIDSEATCAIDDDELPCSSGLSRK